MKEPEGRRVNHEAFRIGTFSSPTARRNQVTSVVREVMSDAGTDPMRILDIGCGSGGQIADLAAIWPKSHFVGVDTSSRNIAAAKLRMDEQGIHDRVELHAVDYLEFASQPVDVVICDSVLQNIDCTDDQLYAKLARDLRRGGRLLVTVPFNCLYNRSLWRLRRVLLAFRGPALDRFALRMARTAHPTWDRQQLAERIPYLYMLPYRIGGEAMTSGLAENGAVEIESRDVRHASLAQPKHRLYVFEQVEV